MPFQQPQIGTGPWWIKDPTNGNKRVGAVYSFATGVEHWFLVDNPNGNVIFARWPPFTIIPAPSPMHLIFEYIPDGAGGVWDMGAPWAIKDLPASNPAVLYKHHIAVTAFQRDYPK